MVCSEALPVVTWFRDAIAVAVIVLLVCVMWKTDRDRTNQRDLPLIRDVRRVTFGLSALSLVAAIILDFSLVAQLILMVCIAVLLAINFTALKRRAPPDNGGSRHRAQSGVNSPVARAWYSFRRMT
jgi:hypothetical protein